MTHIQSLHLCFQDKVLRRPVEITIRHRTRRGTTAKLIRLAIAKSAVDALHALVDIETDAERAKRFHEMKVELMMNLLRVMIDLMRDLNKMSDDLKRAEATLP